MLLRTDAIVLSSAVQGETSRRVTLYSRDKGKLTVLAKGARSARSHFGSSLQVASHVQIVFYYRSPHSLHILNESTHIELYHRILQDPDKLAVAMRICELTSHLTESEDPDPVIYRLLILVMRILNDLDGKEKILLLYFQLQLADTLGFAPAFEKNQVQNLPQHGGYLSFDTGTITADVQAGTPAARATRKALRAFAVLARADFDVALKWPISRTDLAKVHVLTEKFLKYHVADAYPTRGKNVLNKLSQTNDPL